MSCEVVFSRQPVHNESLLGTMRDENTESPIDANAVAAAHDAMAEEYDELHDLWYPWLFARIHELIAENLPPSRGRPLEAADAGCGTGFQSYLLAQAGARVTGFDIADHLLEVARAKEGAMLAHPAKIPPLFQSHKDYPWLRRHHRRLANLLERAREGRPVVAPAFVSADILQYPFGEETLDVITCCGSVLSFVSNYEDAVARMARALKPGGRLFLEVEQKRNCDLLWPLADRLLGGRLEYEQTWGESWRNLFSGWGQSRQVDYPFELTDGERLVLPITLFSVRKLASIFRRNRLRVLEHVGIHAVTNLIPSTVLHGANPGPALRTIFEILRRAESRVGRSWPIWRLGCSVAYCLEKQ